MLWSNLNFWRTITFVLFAAFLVLIFPHLKNDSPRFVLEESSMELVSAPQPGALFKFTVSNEGGRGGEAYVSCVAYLYERGSDFENDYTLLGINGGETKSGELLIPLRPGQTVHDWRVEVN